MEPSFTPDERRVLLDVARAAVDHGLARGWQREIVPADFPAALRVERASFVTLTFDGQLRGCIGTLEAYRPLVEDVAANAANAAFADPRFTPVTVAEAALLGVHISVLTRPQPMTFADEADLLGQLIPGVDGLILQDGRRRGTFLPAVWATLPDPAAFLRQLKVKAGLEPDAWPRDVVVSRYRAQEIE